MMPSSSTDPDPPKKSPDPENGNFSGPNAQSAEAASRSPDGHPHTQLPPSPAAGSHPQMHPPPPYHHPHAMGYPPVMGYPPNHPGPPYPNNYGPYPNYGPPPPPHGGYYPNHGGYPPPHGQPVNGRSDGYVTGYVETVIFIIIIFVVLFNIIPYFLLRPKEPVVHVTAFTVNNFNVSNGVLMASWDAKVDLQNPNKNLKGYFDRIQNFVYYKDQPDNLLAYSSEEPLSVDKGGNATMTFRISMINNEQPESWVVDEIDKERKGSGSVSFGLGIKMTGVFGSGYWSLAERLLVLCDGAKVGFGPAGSNGTLVDHKPVECEAYTK